MKKLIVLLAIVMLTTTAAFSQTSSVTETTDHIVSTYYFIRHAEKDRSNAFNKNPDLITAGHERAMKWRQILSNVTFDAIYTTDYNRTKQTAQPIANKYKLKMFMYDPKNIDTDLFLKQTKGKNVLVVGHSNTTPQFVNALIAKEKYPQIADNNNANLYIVSIVNGVSNSTLLLVN